MEKTFTDINIFDLDHLSLQRTFLGTGILLYSLPVTLTVFCVTRNLFKIWSINNLLFTISNTQYHFPAWPPHSIVPDTQLEVFSGFNFHNSVKFVPRFPGVSDHRVICL